MADQKIPVSSLTAATVASDADLLYVVQGGVSKKLPFSVIKGSLTSGNALTNTFSNDDLTANVLTIIHGSDSRRVQLFIFDDSDIWQLIPFTIVDTNTVSVDFGGAITGTWSYVLVYWNAGIGSSETVLAKIIEIGDWNMDTLDTVSIVHSLDYTKIVEVSVIIIRDTGNQRFNFIGSLGESVNGGCGFINITSTTIGLTRITGGFFDSTNFNATSYNRGFVFIKYTN